MYRACAQPLVPVPAAHPTFAWQPLFGRQLQGPCSRGVWMQVAIKAWGCGRRQGQAAEWHHTAHRPAVPGPVWLRTASGVSFCSSEDGRRTQPAWPHHSTAWQRTFKQFPSSGPRRPLYRRTAGHLCRRCGAVCVLPVQPRDGSACCGAFMRLCVCLQGQLEEQDSVDETDGHVAGTAAPVMSRLAFGGSCENEYTLGQVSILCNCRRWRAIIDDRTH